MKFIKFLYYRYYNFQLRVGNADIAPLSACLLLAFIIMLYYFSVFYVVILFMPNLKLDMNIYKYLSISLFFIIIVWLYLTLVHNGKYKIILKNHEKEYKNKNKLVAILFPLIAFILFNCGWILKMLKNQGKF